MSVLYALRHHSLRNLVGQLQNLFRASLRPTGTVEDGRVLCGHCGSSDTYYFETVGQYGKFLVDAEGNLRIDTGTFAVDDEGADPHVHCHSCDRRSNCPAFEWI